jgi:hypothetical protein
MLLTELGSWWILRNKQFSSLTELPFPKTGIQQLEFTFMKGEKVLYQLKTTVDMSRKGSQRSDCVLTSYVEIPSHAKIHVDKNHSQVTIM